MDKTKKIIVVSNTHWDREFRKSFERTRRNLITMMDTTLDILEEDEDFHSYTMDGHSIMIEDYLEMRPERREQVERFIKEGRLIIGPWYTLVEQFSISHEPLVRNFIWGRKMVEKYGGKPGTVAYTPASWGQTGQLPQILREFGLNKMMFYRGISHHEADAEYIWSAPDGTEVLASRFAVYARYNWYYQVHRAVTRNRVFSKDYQWGEFDEVPFRLADHTLNIGDSYEIKAPVVNYNKDNLKQAILDMVEREGEHFTTEVFLAMNGHDISVAYPLESKIIKDAQELLGDKYEIKHGDLEDFWDEVEQKLDGNQISHLTGERRAHLKEGMWTFLFPATISARTYLKQKDFVASTNLVYYAEPMASLAHTLGADYPEKYLNRGWKYLLSNHTHDANGGCAPDAVCKDMEYRYRKVNDISDIVTEDAMSYIAKNISPAEQSKEAIQLVVYNTLPFARDAVVPIELEIPEKFEAKAVSLESENDSNVEYQPVYDEKSSVFMDTIWDVPLILDTNNIKFYARFNNLPALGYRSYKVVPEKEETRQTQTLIKGSNIMENEFLQVKVNNNGTIDILNKETGKRYRDLNYLTDQGEVGNAWKHEDPRFDRKYNSLGVTADMSVVESGPLSSTIMVEYDFKVPVDSPDEKSRNQELVGLPVKVKYTLEKGTEEVKVELSVDNKARDHWLRVNIPTDLDTDVTWADSHYDVVSRPIPLPDSTGWVEEARGTHPLRTFVEMNDGENGLGLITKGIFEYEAFEDKRRTLALTLIRACRIKLAVSEEKKTIIPDKGIQCPGKQEFKYAINCHSGDWKQSKLLNKAAEYYTPIRCAVSGRGKGDLPREAGFFTIDNTELHITAVKKAENGEGLIVRLFNPGENKEEFNLNFEQDIKKVILCKLDESDIKEIKTNNNNINYEIDSKKIRTFKIILEG